MASPRLRIEPSTTSSLLLAQRVASAHAVVSRSDCSMLMFHAENAVSKRTSLI
jgi:hypothetical protein